MSSANLAPTYNGRVQASGVEATTYNTIHDQASGQAAIDNAAASGGPGNQKFSGEFIIDRMELIFDPVAAGIPASAVVAVGTAILNTYMNTIRNDDGDSLSFVGPCTPASDTALDVADIDQIGDAVTNPTKIATDKLFSGISAAANLATTLNAAGEAVINAAIAGQYKIRIGLRTKNDCSRTSPPGRNFVDYDQKDGTNPPSLVFDYISNYSLTLAQGSYSLTGQNLGLSLGFGISAGQGSYTLTGKVLSFAFSLSILAGQGAYVLTGQAAVLGRGIIFALATGYYTLTGFVLSFFGYTKRTKPSIGTYTKRTKPSIGTYTKRTKPPGY